MNDKETVCQTETCGVSVGPELISVPVLGIFGDSRNDGVVRGDKNEAALGDLCTRNADGRVRDGV